MELKFKTFFAAVCIGFFTEIIFGAVLALLADKLNGGKVISSIAYFASLVAGGCTSGLIMGLFWPGKGLWGPVLCILASPGLYLFNLEFLGLATDPDEQDYKIPMRVAELILPIISAVATMLFIQHHKRIPDVRELSKTGA